MKWKTQRHFSEEAFLSATFSEFVKCWGSGKRARIFVESMNGSAFVNFSTFLGNPGSDHINRRKMAATTSRHPEGRHEDTPRHPHSGPAPTSSRKKSKRKTERDNKRAAEFQKRKADEAERGVSTATANPSEEKEVTATENPTEEEEATATKKEVAKAANNASGNDFKDSKTANENGAKTSNDARVSVINVTDKTLGVDLHSAKNIHKLSFHDNSDTDSEELLNVDGNESLQDLEEANGPTLQSLFAKPQTDQLDNNDPQIERPCIESICGKLDFSRDILFDKCDPCKEREVNRLNKMKKMKDGESSFSFSFTD